MKKYLEVLEQCALFDRIEEEKLLRMLECLGASVSEYDRKYTIFAEGQSARHIGIMLSGSAQIVQTDYYGNRSIIAGAAASETIGEAFACAEVSSLPVSIIASEPCEVMLIDCSHILHTCSNSCGFHQQLIYNLMKLLATKNLMFHQKIEITSRRSTREKLLAYLNSCSKRAGSNSFDVPFDRQELADYLEVDRSGLSAEISKLRREGIIDSHRKHFELL
ncbi:MAG: Crp/Fnr family transcriptional regulator [Ruminococcaceae bacterium]|nr:Crp/Fnr family transcriptional regulator [Oscillospiraceae bacterium]